MGRPENAYCMNWVDMGGVEGRGGGEERRRGEEGRGGGEGRRRGKEEKGGGEGGGEEGGDPHLSSSTPLLGKTPDICIVA